MSKESSSGTPFDSLLGSQGGGNAAMNVVGAVTPNDSLFPSLSLKQRLIGFAICAGIGFLLSVIGGLMLIFGNFQAFGILYSIGNLVTILSTCFLVGPVKQFKSMVESSRLISTIIFFVSLGATLAVAFTIQSGGLVILLVVVQWLAFAWYSLSYIPFAQSCVKKAVGSVVA
uniref:Vesicle transport protein n=1 Tax=Arcella intermedia TaxID=1963864 RepID=A0A6B2LLI6_9EUKA